jgi:hypothetical protein
LFASLSVTERRPWAAANTMDQGDSQMPPLPIDFDIDWSLFDNDWNIG